MKAEDFVRIHAHHDRVMTLHDQVNDLELERLQSTLGTTESVLSPETDRAQPHPLARVPEEG